MRVLIACECSGKVRREFMDRGHDAWSCDHKPADDGSPCHIQGDALAAVRHGCPTDRKPWDLVIAHPPCTRLALSGSLRLYVDGKFSRGRDLHKFREMREGADFFRSFFEMRHQFGFKLCVENPRMHGHAMKAHGQGPASQTIQPHEFGDDASKATCLWLRDLPLLVATHAPDADFFAQPGPAPRIVGGLPRYANQTDSGQNRLAPSPTRAAERAVTYAGVARAMSLQWG